MKRLFALALVLCMCFAILVSAEDVKPITVTLDGAVIDCASYGQEATIVEGRTMVPLRAIFEALGADVIWDKNTRTVLSARNGTLVELGIGSNVLVRNKQNVEIDVPAQIMNGRTMVPARAIAESFGVAVEWDNNSRTVLLTSADEIVKKSNDDIESVLRDSKAYSIFNYGMTMQECWDLISPEGGRKELVAFKDGRAEIHISKNLDKFEYADSEITGDCDIILVRLLFEGDYLYSVYVISNYCDTLEESLEALKPIVEYYGSDYESDPRYDDSDDTRWYTWKNENEKVKCNFSDVYESATDVNSRLGNNYSLFLTDIQAKAQIDRDNVISGNVPTEAKETAEKFLGALLKMDMTTAAEYCTDPELLRSLNLSGYEDMFSMMGFDRESLKAVYLELLQFDPEVYGNVAEALADVSLDLYVGVLEKLYCEIVSYTMVDENHIKVEYLLYAPDTSVIETLSGETVEELINLASAALATGTTEFSLETEKDIADALAALMVEYSDAVIEKKLASLEVVTDGKINEDTVINVNGTWLVECDEDDSSALSGLLENGFNFAE